MGHRPRCSTRPSLEGNVFVRLKRSLLDDLDRAVRLFKDSDFSARVTRAIEYELAYPNRSNSEANAILQELAAKYQKPTGMQMETIETAIGAKERLCLLV
jgi:hypothetical protein